MGYIVCMIFFRKAEIKEKNLIQKKMTKIIPFFLFLIEKL